MSTAEKTAPEQKAARTTPARVTIEFTDAEIDRIAFDLEVSVFGPSIRRDARENPSAEHLGSRLGLDWRNDAAPGAAYKHGARIPHQNAVEFENSRLGLDWRTDAGRDARRQAN